DVDLIPKVLTLTVGTRHFEFENSLAGSVLASFGCFEGGVPANGCHNTSVPYSFDLNTAHLSDTESGFKSRANLTWHITPDTMVYYTFSQGFRPGGFNRTRGLEAPITNGGVEQYDKPQGYAPDQ